MTHGCVTALRFLPAILLAVAAGAGARAAETPAPLRKQDVQQQVREQAQGLVTRVLDVQLRNLEENKLQGHPLYREVREMRTSIDTLVAGEMRLVTELLARAHDAPAAEREQAVTQARQLIREIVARLAAQRQLLRRRLKSAELGSQVERVIAAQTAVWKVTQTLPELPALRREKATLAVAEDQRDVRQRYLQLAEALREVSRWGGEAGTSAAEALRLLDADALEAGFDKTAAALESLQLAQAARSQAEVLEALQRLRAHLAASSSGVPHGAEADLQAVQRLKEQQTALRERTRAADLHGEEADALVQAQGAIRKELERLAPRHASNPALHEEFDQARAVAVEATRRLFDAERDPALDRQDEVIQRLETIAAQLRERNEGAEPDRSARDLAAAVGELDQARDEIERVERKQAGVAREAADDPDAARRSEGEVAAGLEEIGRRHELPSAVATRMKAARDAAHGAEKALGDRGKRPEDEASRRAVARADEALERAASEIEAALNDARRQAQGARVGELSRAAEALDRAAGAERELAEAERQAAAGDGLSAEAIDGLRADQEQIARIAEKIAAALAELSAPGDNDLQQARDASKASANELAEARKSAGPGSRDALEQAAPRAEAAAEGLSRVARALREEVADEARELAEESDRQAKEARAARDAIEEAIQSAEPPAGEPLERLAEASRHIRAALARQQRAAGRPAAADALELADRIRTAGEQQEVATEAARRQAEGDLDTPLDAIASQQEAAQRIGELADAARERGERGAERDDSAAAGIAKALRQAAASADRAARAQLDRRGAAATAEAAATRSALEEAQRLVDAQAEQAAAAPAGPPDVAAQREVEQEAAAARERAAADASAATGSLRQAEGHSREAAAATEAGDATRARGAQRQTESELRTAEAQIRAAMNDLSKKQTTQMREKAASAGRLARQTAPVDPGALTALREAQAAAGRKGGAPSQRNAAQARAGQETQRAADSLSAREQRIGRDRAAAQAIAASAAAQQAAADRIASARGKLESGAEGAKSAGAGSKGTADKSAAETAAASRGARQAAGELNEAQQEFADAQRSAGEGAEAIAGQSQIANRSLREALQLASQLSRGAAATANETGKADTADGSTPGDAHPGAGSELGTSFVPSSPEVTAQMMAGKTALAQAAQFGPSPPAKAQPGKGQSGTPGPDGSAPAPGQGGEMPGEEGEPVPGDGRRGEESGGEEDEIGAGGSPSSGVPGKGTSRPPTPSLPGQAGARAAAPGDLQAVKPRREEPWLVRLPPELRKAIRARAQRPPPPGYRDRLQRYFESLE